MVPFHLGYDHRICLNLASGLFFTFQHLRPDSLGHLGVHLVRTVLSNSSFCCERFLSA